MKAQAHSTTVSSLLFMGMKFAFIAHGDGNEDVLPQIEVSLFRGVEQKNECKPLFV